MSDTNTDFSNRCNILSELWINYKTNESFTDFVEYNDLGLPLAFAITENIVMPTDTAKSYINETFDLLLEAVGAKDTGYTSLDELLAGFEGI